MPSIIDQLTEIYVFIDDHLKQHPEKAQWRGSNNDEPAFSDTEVLTIGLSQSALGVQSLKETYQKIRDNHREDVPHLPRGYKQWLARLHALSHLVSDLLVASTALLSDQPKLYLIDSKPIPICHPLPPRPREADARRRGLFRPKPRKVGSSVSNFILSGTSPGEWSISF